MAFKKQIPALELETTTIENIFLTEYLPIADGNALKVYLLGYHYACDTETHSQFSHDTLAKHLRLTLPEVLDAWNFWAEKGLIRKTDLKPENPQCFSVEFVSLRQLYLEDHYKPRHDRLTDTTGAAELPKDASPIRVAEEMSNEETKKIIKELGRILDRSLYPNDIIRITGWLDKWQIDWNTVILSFEKAVLNKPLTGRSTHSILNATENLVRTWYEQNTEKQTPEVPLQIPKAKPKSKFTKPNRFHNFEGWLSKLSEAEVDELMKSRNK